MKDFKKQIVKSLTILSIIFAIGCSESENQLSQDVTIQDNVAILESGEWLLKGFEDSVMYTFNKGERSTYYGTDGQFSEPIPGKNDYSIVDSKLMIDFNFGNTKTYELRISCKNNIIEMYEDGVLNSTLYRKDSNFKNCLN